MARILFTSRPLAGPLRPLVPLARAAREAGHDVAFATDGPLDEGARGRASKPFEPARIRLSVSAGPQHPSTSAFGATNSGVLLRELAGRCGLGRRSAHAGVSYGALVARHVLEVAGAASARHWEARGLRPDPTRSTPCRPRRRRGIGVTRLLR